MKIPPQNIAYEESILASCLLGDAYDIVGLLSHDDFYNPTYAKVFKTIQAMVDKNMPVDLSTVTAETAGTEIKASTLSEIVYNAPVATNMDFYAEEIRKKAALRKLITKCESVTAKAYDQSHGADEIINIAQSEILAIQYSKAASASCHIRDLCMEIVDEVEKRMDNPKSVNGIPSGFIDVDRTLHGFQPCDFIILAARPSIGKTALMLDMVRKQVLNDIPVAVFSLEMSRKQLLYRMAAQLSGVGTDKLLTGKISKDEESAFSDAMSKLYKAPLYVDDKPDFSPVELRSRLRKMNHEHGVKIAFLDYLQLMDSESKPTRDREVAGISKGIKAAAKDIGIPIVALSQLSRAVDSRPDHRPVLSDLRDSGTLEQDADIVMFLYRAERYITQKYDEKGNEMKAYTDLKNAAELLISKNRNGPTGFASLFWMPEITSFGNVERYRDGGTN